MDSKTIFWRMFEDGMHIYEEGEDYYCICGDCAWSIETCCRANGYSSGIDLLAINTRDCNLKCEIWSEESGMCLQEHYVYDRGVCLVDEFKEDWYEWVLDWYNSLEELNEDCGTEFTEDDFDEEGVHTEGGFGDRYCSWEI